MPYFKAEETGCQRVPVGAVAIEETVLTHLDREEHGN